MEKLWFGPWKDLLLGGLSDHKHIDYPQKKPSKDLEYVQPEEPLTETIKKRRCYVSGKERFNNGIVSSLVSDLLNIVRGNGEEKYVDIREPVILVPDSDIQKILMDPHEFLKKIGLDEESVSACNSPPYHKSPKLMSIEEDFDPWANNSPHFVLTESPKRSATQYASTRRQ